MQEGIAGQSNDFDGRLQSDYATSSALECHNGCQTVAGRVPWIINFLVHSVQGGPTGFNIRN